MKSLKHWHTSAVKGHCSAVQCNKHVKIGEMLLQGEVQPSVGSQVCNLDGGKVLISLHGCMTA